MYEKPVTRQLAIWHDYGVVEIRKSNKLPELTPEQRLAHEQFSRMEITLERLLEVCRPVLTLSFTPNERRAECHFRPPSPGVPITRRQVEDARERRASGMATAGDAMVWATVILLSEAYDIDPADEDWIADELNAMSWSEN